MSCIHILYSMLNKYYACSCLFLSFALQATLACLGGVCVLCQTSWQCLLTAVSSYLTAVYFRYNTVLHMYICSLVQNFTVHVHCVHLYNTVVFMYVVFTCTSLYCTCTLCSSVQHCSVHVHCVHLYNTVLYMYKCVFIY